jgi:hypothetical protein
VSRIFAPVLGMVPSFLVFGFKRRHWFVDFMIYAGFRILFGFKLNKSERFFKLVVRLLRPLNLPEIDCAGLS